MQIRRSRPEVLDGAVAVPEDGPQTSRRFDVLVATAGGRPVVRLGVGRSALAGGLLLFALAFFVIGALGGDYVALRAQRAELLAAGPRLRAQEAQLAVYQGRLRELHAELEGWREVRAGIWRAFGPASGAVAPGGGIGGRSAPLPLAEVVRGASRGAADAGSPADGPDGIRDELERLTALVKEEGEGLRSLQQFLARATRVLAALPSRWPLLGPINSEFGRRTSPWSAGSELHSGIDIGASVGTPVHAPAPGVVAFAGRHPEYGIAVIIDHGNDIRSLYGHLSHLNVGPNQGVRRGDLIAASGNTGRSSGPHLHYEIQVNGQAVNPHGFLWE